ncbi:MAG: SDR family NAD(P)-dependent oxidoreductase [Pseudomonadota bacterium]
MKIVDKHIIITGGASGIGLELVRHLYNDNVISVVARPSSGLEKLRRDFDGVRILEADLADLKSVEKAADQLIKTGMEIDILINNAAVQHAPHFLDDDFRFETIKREIDINFTSVCTLIYLLLPGLIKEEQSTILNVNSGLALAPKTGSAVYCATKGALNIFSQSLRYQLEHTNIKVKQVFLPLVDTAMTKGRGTGKLSAARAASEIINALSSSDPVEDIGKVKLLRIVQRLSPALAARIMKAA